MNAKEMFKQLGYEFEKEYTRYGVNDTYRYNKCSRPIDSVIFYLDGKQIIINQTFHTIHLNELQAIIQQCKELGWLGSESNQETNLDHYFEDLLKTGGRYAFVNGKIKHCWNTRCCDCAFKGGNCHGEKIKWLASPYEKQTYKLTQFEYDLLQYFSVDFKFKEMGLLKEMKEKGHFKNINGDELIKDILESCEVIK
jgi:hypothetical protein